ncbi:probable WRKY transcription factor 17 [Olea europaea subsp. europaea]|nr:probable WRKY transcription factor 17 [Olea europaea subsp. europaea]
MAVDFLSYASINEQIALQEHQHHNQMLECTEISDSNVSKFRKAISKRNQIGHARFRRSADTAVQNQPQFSAVPPPPPSTSGFYQNPVYGSPAPLVTLDFPKHCMVGPTPFNESFSTSPKLSTSGNTLSSTFVSSTTGEGTVSNGKSVSQQSKFLIKAAPLASSVEPSVSRKICHEHEQSDNVSGKTNGSGSCHCKKRKYRLKNTIRVPAISMNSADTPQDEYSWRKYGQKPIKGSPYPR